MDLNFRSFTDPLHRLRPQETVLERIKREREEREKNNKPRFTMEVKEPTKFEKTPLLMKKMETKKIKKKEEDPLLMKKMETKKIKKKEEDPFSSFTKTAGTTPQTDVDAPNVFKQVGTSIIEAPENVKKIFEPKAGEVRARDVIREIPSATKKVGEKVGEAWKKATSPAEEPVPIRRMFKEEYDETRLPLTVRIAAEIGFRTAEVPFSIGRSLLLEVPRAVGTVLNEGRLPTSADLKLRKMGERRYDTAFEIMKDTQDYLIEETGMDEFDAIGVSTGLAGLIAIADLTFTGGLVKSGARAITTRTASSPMLGIQADSLRGVSKKEAIQTVINRWGDKYQEILREGVRQTAKDAAEEALKKGLQPSQKTLTPNGRRRMAELFMETNRIVKSILGDSLPELNKIGRLLDEGAIMLQQDIRQLDKIRRIMPEPVMRPGAETLPGYKAQPGQSRPVGMSTQRVDRVGGEYVAEGLEDIGTDGGVSDYILNKVKKENYKPETISIKELRSLDPDLDEYLKSGQLREFEGEPFAMNPIVTSKGEVVDGYNRIAQAIANGETEVEVLRGVDPDTDLMEKARQYETPDEFIEAQIGYRGDHTAPTRPDAEEWLWSSLDDFSDIYPEDIYSPQGARYYGHGGDNKAMDEETIEIMRKFRGEPEKEITIYRAVPKDAPDEIRAGDWVTINKNYATQHGESILGGEYKIISEKTKAADIFTQGDSIHEWGYDPEVGGFKSADELRDLWDKANTERKVEKYVPSRSELLLSLPKQIINKATSAKTLEEFQTKLNDEEELIISRAFYPVVTQEDIWELLNKPKKLPDSAEKIIAERIGYLTVEEIMQRLWPFVENSAKSSGYRTPKDYLRAEEPEHIARELDNNRGPYELFVEYIGKDVADSISTADVIRMYQDGKIPNSVVPRKQLDIKRPVGDGEVPKQRAFFEPRMDHIKNPVATYKKAIQKVTKKNRTAILKARKDLFYLWNTDPELAKKLKISDSELNKRIYGFSKGRVQGRELEKSLNRDVPDQFRWVGISNASYVNRNTPTLKELEGMVKDINDTSSLRTFHGPDGKQLRTYIMNTFMNLDARLRYDDLSFVIEALYGALGEFNHHTLTITVDEGFRHTVAHEIGHYLDNRFSREFGMLGYLSEGPFNWELLKKNKGITDDHIEWARDFQDFVGEIATKSEIGTDAEFATYVQRKREVFARFTAKFVEWTNNEAGVDLGGHSESQFYRDTFELSDFKNFVHLLQRKGSIDTKYGIKPLLDGKGNDIVWADNDVAQDRGWMSLSGEEKIPDVEMKTKKALTVKDLQGNKHPVAIGTIIRAKQLPKKQYQIQTPDKTFTLNKNQYQNLTNQSSLKRMQEFAPELDGLAEVFYKEEFLTEDDVKSVKKNRKSLPTDSGEFMDSVWWEVEFNNGQKFTIYGYRARNKKEAIEKAVKYQVRKKGVQPKYSKYQLPGGEDYKEIILQAPENLFITPKEYEELEKIAFEKFNRSYYSLENENSVEANKYREEVRREYDIRNPDGRSVVELNNTLYYASAHWNEITNPIAHLRMNYRAYKEEKTAFIEETQSDWMRELRAEARRMAYKDGKEDKEAINEYIRKLLSGAKLEETPASKAIKELEQNGYLVEQDMDGSAYIVERGREKIVEYDDLEPEIQSLVDVAFEGVGDYSELGKVSFPTHPSLKNWLELTIKRALQDAVQNNAKHLAWINGEQTSERYALSTHIENVEWGTKATTDVGPGGTKGIRVYPKGESRFLEFSINDEGRITSVEDIKMLEWKGKQLDQVLGKGLADEIMGADQGELAGEGLKFGGEWAENLYDKHFKSIVEDLTGEKVREIDLGLPVKKSAKRFTTGQDEELTVDKLEIGKEVYLDGQEKFVIIDVFKGEGKFKAVHGRDDLSTVELVEWATFYADSVKIKTFDISGGKTKQQSIPITDNVRARVMGEEAFGAVSGFEADEDGELSFSPSKAFLGMLGMRSFKKANPNILAKARRAVSPQTFRRSLTPVETTALSRAAVTPEQVFREARSEGIIGKDEMDSFEEMAEMEAGLGDEFTVRSGQEELVKKEDPAEIILNRVEEINLKEQELQLMRETLDDDPAKRLAKYANRNQELPEVGMDRGGKQPKSIFAREGDSIVTELGYGDSEEARDAYRNYVTKKELYNTEKAELAELKREVRELARKAEENVRVGGEASSRLNMPTTSNPMTEKEIIHRRREFVKDLRDRFGLADSDLRKINKRDIRLMNNYEFKQFIDGMELKAIEFVRKRNAKNQLLATIEYKRLQKVENYRKAQALPPVSKMTASELETFTEKLEQFQVGDTFLTKRSLEVIDRTDLRGIKTTREVKERLAKELEKVTGQKFEAGELEQAMSWGPLDDFLNKFRYDTALAETNPFLELVVKRVQEQQIEASGRFLKIQEDINRLAKAAKESRKRGPLARVKHALVPRYTDIIAYLEASPVDKPKIRNSLTDQELDYAAYVEKYYAEAYEHLIAIKEIYGSRFVDQYFTHTRKLFLEKWSDDGFLEAVKNYWTSQREDQIIANIIDQDTGQILPLSKFFQYTIQRSGGLDPSQNLTRVFLQYARAFEKKKMFDNIIPEIQVYAQSLTPQDLTPKGLEMDRSIKTFIKKYLNNKKGRRENYGGVVKQNGPVDLFVRSGNAFVSMMDLGLNIFASSAATVGEMMMTYQSLGKIRTAVALKRRIWDTGLKRMATKKGKDILKEAEPFVGRNIWTDLTDVDQQFGERAAKVIFAPYSQATVEANKIFLLGTLTKEELKAGTLSAEKMAELRLAAGRWRDMGGEVKSIIGSTSLGAASTKYKGWAIPILRTNIKNLTELSRKIKSKDFKGAATSREIQELYRGLEMTLIILTIGGYLIAEDKDNTFAGKLKARVYMEAMTFMQGIDPALFISTPRLMNYIGDLVDNLRSIVLLETYKQDSRWGEAGDLKGVGGLQRQFTPRVFSQFQGTGSGMSIGGRGSSGTGAIDFGFGGEDSEFDSIDFGFEGDNSGSTGEVDFGF